MLSLLIPIEHSFLNITYLYGVRKYKDQWDDLDLTTLHTYFGLLLLAGVYRSYDECITQHWIDRTSRPKFKAMML